MADAASPPRASALAEAGYKGICRYGSTPRNNFKNLRLDEMPGYMFFKLCLIANGEQSETTWQSGYSDANIRLAKATYDIFKEVGYPDWAPIPFSLDTDVRPGDQRAWGAFKAYKDTVPNPLWCYGGSQIIEWLAAEGLVVGGWVASALWWSRTPDPVDNVNVFQYKAGLTRFNYYITPLANFRQYNSINFDGTRIDPNDALRDTAVWYPGDDKVDPPHPVHQEEDMPIYRYSPEGYVAEISMGHKVWVSGDYFYGVVQGQLQGSGVPSPLGIYAQPASLEQISAIADYVPGGGGTGQVINGFHLDSIPGDARVI